MQVCLITILWVFVLASCSKQNDVRPEPNKASAERAVGQGHASTERTIVPVLPLKGAPQRPATLDDLAARRPEIDRMIADLKSGDVTRIKAVSDWLGGSALKLSTSDLKAGDTTWFSFQWHRLVMSPDCPLEDRKRYADMLGALAAAADRADMKDSPSAVSAAMILSDKHFMSIKDVGATHSERWQSNYFHAELVKLNGGSKP